MHLQRSAVVGQALDKVFAAEHAPVLIDAIDRCLATSTTVRTGAQLRATAKPRFIELAVHNARTDGFSDHVVVVAEERGLTQLPTKLKRSAPYYFAGFNEPYLSFLHDLKSDRARYADNGLAGRMGLTKGALNFHDFRSRAHPDDLLDAEICHAQRNALGAGEFMTQAIRMQDIYGEWRLINIRTRVLKRDRLGMVRLMIGTATDITDSVPAAIEAARISLVHAEENERARIGRELHDSTAQYLVAADLGLARVLRGQGLSLEDRERLAGVQASLSSAQSEMRTFSFFLHPPELRDQGLTEALRKFCAGFARRTGLEIAFSALDVPDQIASAAQHALFRVSQEALMNVYRHAFARRVRVTLALGDGYLTLEIRDDGVGMGALGQLEHGVGLASMRSRILNIGGELTIGGQPPGLTIVARLPLSALQPDEHV